MNRLPLYGVAGFLGAMSKQIIIKGHSDDIINVEGAIRDEFYPDSSDKMAIATNNGTLLAFEYTTGGIWRAKIIKEGLNKVDHDVNPESDEERYSDIVTITGEIEWVIFGKIEQLKK